MHARTYWCKCPAPVGPCRLPYGEPVTDGPGQRRAHAMRPTPWLRQAERATLARARAVARSRRAMRDSPVPKHAPQQKVIPKVRDDSCFSAKNSSLQGQPHATFLRGTDSPPGLLKEFMDRSAGLTRRREIELLDARRYCGDRSLALPFLSYEKISRTGGIIHGALLRYQRLSEPKLYQSDSLWARARRKTGSRRYWSGRTLPSSLVRV